MGDKNENFVKKTSTEIRGKNPESVKKKKPIQPAILDINII